MTGIIPAAVAVQIIHAGSLVRPFTTLVQQDGESQTVGKMASGQRRKAHHHVLIKVMAAQTKV